jgi:hypothetical protein
MEENGLVPQPTKKSVTKAINTAVMLDDFNLAGELRFGPNPMDSRRALPCFTAKRQPITEAARDAAQALKLWHWLWMVYFIIQSHGCGKAVIHAGHIFSEKEESCGGSGWLDLN